MKKISIIIILMLLIIFLGVFVVESTYTKLSIPIGMLLILLPITALCLFLEIRVIKNMSKKQNKKEKIAYIVLLLILSFCVISIFIKDVQVITDLINGPQEIIINNATVKVKKGAGRSGSRSITRYYLECKTQDNENISFKVRTKKRSEDIFKLLKETKINYDVYGKYKVYYYKNLNEVYKVEEYK